MARETGRRVPGWMRARTDASGRVHATPGAKHEADLRITQDQELAAKKAASASAIGFDNAQNFARQEQALDIMQDGIDRIGLTGAARELALDPIRRASAALHTPGHGAYAFTDLLTDRGKAGGVRQFVGLAPENHPQHRPQEPTIITDFSRAVEQHRQQTGCDLVTAIQRVQAARPDLALRYGAEVTAAVDRQVAARSGWTDADEKQLDALVQRRVEKTGESYGDALMVLARENRDLFDGRTRALSIPVGPGGVPMADVGRGGVALTNVAPTTREADRARDPQQAEAIDRVNGVRAMTTPPDSTNRRKRRQRYVNNAEQDFMSYGVE